MFLMAYSITVGPGHRGACNRHRRRLRSRIWADAILWLSLRASAPLSEKERCGYIIRTPSAGAGRVATAHKRPRPPHLSGEYPLSLRRDESRRCRDIRRRGNHSIGSSTQSPDSEPRAEPCRLRFDTAAAGWPVRSAQPHPRTCEQDPHQLRRGVVRFPAIFA
jgi:hypothetical protein